MNVPLLDLKEQYRTIAGELMAAVTEVVEDQRFILGPVVDRFEEAVAEKLGVKHAIGCASGTDALLLPFRAFDCGPGTEVIVPPFTLFATAGEGHTARARPASDAPH